MKKVLTFLTKKRVKILVIMALAFSILLGLFVMSLQASATPMAISSVNIASETQVVEQTIADAGSENSYVEKLKDSLKAISGLFDNFIAFTPDPTGKSWCFKKDSGMVCSMATSAQDLDGITFPASGATIPTTTSLSNRLASISYLIGILLICIQGYSFIINPERTELRSFGVRVLLALALAILTPFIMSISIAFVNLFSSWMLGNTTLTEYIMRFTDSLNIPAANTNMYQDTINGFYKAITLGNVSLMDFLAAIPFIIPLGMVLLLLLYLSFQFVIRFLYLYFLAAIYPIIAVFALHPKTQSIVNSYWQQWTTFMIQQPVFMIGFVLIKEVLKSIFDKGISFESIIIFIGLLLFLASINLLAARLWGDIYSVISQNVIAAVGANMVKTAIIDKPLQYGSQISNMFSAGKMERIGNKYLGKDNPLSKAGSSKAKLPGESGSPLAKEFRGAGYQVYDNENGQLNVSGNFYKDKNAGTDTTTALYTSQQGAEHAGLKPENIQQIPVQNLWVQDTSNKKMMNQYNDSIKQEAAYNNGHAKGVGLGYRSNDTKVAKSMEIGHERNLAHKVQAVAVKNDAPNGDRTITGDNILKVHAYSEVINNQR